MNRSPSDIFRHNRRRSSAFRCVCATLVAGCVLLGCAHEGATKPVPDKSTCGAASDLEMYTGKDSEFAGYALARIGPVWLSAFGRVDGGKANISEFTKGSPTKVLIHPEGLADTVRLTGFSCASRAALRFCYIEAGCEFQASQALGGQGVDNLPIEPKTDYHGYMLFDTRGLYQIVVREPNATEYSVTLSVG